MVASRPITWGASLLLAGNFFHPEAVAQSTRSLSSGILSLCDTYGVGFLQLAGSETCLSTYGYVWFSVAAGNFNDALDTIGGYDGTNLDVWQVSTRARVNFDIRSETEWGALRAYLRMESSWGQSAPSYSRCNLG